MRKSKINKVYLDTSVIGGVFDFEFDKDSQNIFGLAREKKIILVTSQLVLDELKEAPRTVKDFLKSNISLFEKIEMSHEAIELMGVYLKAKIVTQKSRNDALHVALATVNHVDAIVSWNFKHIVKLDKMKKYTSCNLENGYGILQIISPKEI